MDVLSQDQHETLLHEIIKAIESEGAFPIALANIRKLPSIGQLLNPYTDPNKTDKERKFLRNEILDTLLMYGVMQGILTTKDIDGSIHYSCVSGAILMQSSEISYNDTPTQPSRPTSAIQNDTATEVTPTISSSNPINDDDYQPQIEFSFRRRGQKDPNHQPKTLISFGQHLPAMNSNTTPAQFPIPDESTELILEMSSSSILNDPIEPTPVLDEPIQPVITFINEPTSVETIESSPTTKQNHITRANHTTDNTPKPSTQPSVYGRNKDILVGPRNKDKSVGAITPSTPLPTANNIQNNQSPAQKPLSPTNNLAVEYQTGKKPSDNLRRVSSDTPQPNLNTPPARQRVDNRPKGPRKDANLPVINATSPTPQLASDGTYYYEEQLESGRVIRLSKMLIDDWMAENNGTVIDAINALRKSFL